MCNDRKRQGVIETTLSWYKENAFLYAEKTKYSLVYDALGEFLSRVEEKGRILDFGCGSGRDSHYFLERGFSVDSLDGSEEMKREANRLFGIDVRLSSFLSLCEYEKYDGVWAQASILHLEEGDLRKALSLISKALKKGGVFYSSFRKGEEDGYEEGRWYTNMTESRFASLIPSNLCVEKAWEGKDVRPGVDNTWLSIISRKES